MQKIAECCRHTGDAVFERQPFWNDHFYPVLCKDINSFDVQFGHEIALTIKTAKEQGRKLAMIFPVGPLGMYKWTVFFLKEWDINCDHLHGFNMDEWSDVNGKEMDMHTPGCFRKAMNEAFYTPLGKLAPPEQQRHFATQDELPQYSAKIAALKAEGAQLVTVFGIGRCFHIAFWEPHFAADFSNEQEWKNAAYRLGAKLHPITVEQNAQWWFKSLTPAAPSRANTIGPQLFLQSDKVIGGCFGQMGIAILTTLRYGPSMWVPSSYMPTMPGKLFFTSETIQPMTVEAFVDTI